MPIILIKDYSWRQTEEYIILNVPLKGHPKKVDLFIIDNYAKISFPPFILELFLWANVIEKESKCTLTEQEAIFTLRKANIGLVWPALEIQDVDNDFKRECRNQALERAHRVAEDNTKAKNEKQQQLQKEAVKEQISIHTTTLNKIDAIRNAHRKEAMHEFEDWRSKAELPFLTKVEGELQENRKTYKPPLKWFKDENNELKSRPKTEEEIFNGDVPKRSDKSVLGVKNEIKSNEKKDDIPENVGGDSSEDSETDREVKENLCDKKKRPGLDAVKAAIEGNLGKKEGKNKIFDEPEKSVPLPRRTGTINVTFSDRKFPTPARESSHVEEQEGSWLKKQADARRKIGFDADDLRPEERDPQWLKDKGDDFFQVGNYLAAISAYSYGIKISDKMASLYVNRSAAHYALGNFYRCIDDCSKALELMEPKCEGNRESRARCHARRGAALCKLSAPQHGIPELEAALRLTPDNESIKRDVLAAKRYFDVKE